MPLGDPLWLGFNGGAEGTRCYYGALDTWFPSICSDALTGCGGFLGLNCRGLKTFAPRQERIVQGGRCRHSSRCSSPSRSALASPIFLRLAPHGRRRGFLILSQ